MSEEKVYEFGDTSVKLTGQSISATLDWSVIEKIKEGKTDFIAFVSNGKGVHFLPKSGFTSDEAIKEFKALVKAKSIKNNFKS